MGEKMSKKLGVMMVLTILVVLAMEAHHVECNNFMIPMYPCDPLSCLTRCEEVRENKFKGSHCENNPGGSFCVCT
ncbi:hypothetical protein ACSQ67_008908 [Phaseolus vulgaris]